MLAVFRVLLRALELLVLLPFRILHRRARPRCLQPPLGPAALRRRRRHRLYFPRADARLRRGADPRRSSATTRWARSCTTTPSAGWRPPSTTRAATSSAPSIRASIACATSTTPARRSTSATTSPTPTTSRSPCARCRSTTGNASSITRTATSAACSIRSASTCRRPEDPALDGAPLDRRAAPGARRRRLDARHAVRARHLQDAAAAPAKARSPS